MSQNLTDYAIIPSLASGMLQNFTDCALTLPFDFWHVTELHGSPNDGCRVPRSGQPRVASQQTDGPQTKLGYDTYLDWVFSWFLNLESWILILIVLESWLLKLDWILRLNYSWILILWNLINSWFFGIIKIILEVIASTKLPSMQDSTMEAWQTFCTCRPSNTWTY